MADKKISQLPASTTPLAGTEVLPIVQGATPTTKQVSVADLTTGRPVSATQYTSTIATGTAPLIVASTTEVANLKAATATLADSANAVKSNTTTGLLQVTGPAAATTRVMTTPDANFTVARTDAANTFTGTQTLSSNPVLSAGTANGVVYLDGSKVATSGSAFTFDGFNPSTVYAGAGAGYKAKGSASSTNPDASANRGAIVNLVNLDTTDGNGNAIIFANKNELSSSYINGINVSHTGRTGAIVFGTSNGAAPTERNRIDENGYSLIGYTASNGAYRLQVNSQIFATSSTIATSDKRYKKDLQQLDDALDIVCALNPVQFSWKQHPIHNFDTENATVGFIAQEVKEVLSKKPYVNSIVKTNVCVIEAEQIDENKNVIKPAVTEEFLGIAEGNLIAILTKAIQELKAKNDELEIRIAAIESK